MATINYWGLSGVKDSVTVALTITIDQLISAIATDEGLSTDYYKVSVLTNPAINDTTYGDSSSTLTSIGIVDGDTILCTPNQHGTKEARQVQKLTIAAKARANDSNARASYDISQLPTKYSGNDLVDNTNSGGLIEGRPWISAPVWSGTTSSLVLNLWTAPTTGTTWTDASGNGYDGTLRKVGTGTATYTATNGGGITLGPSNATNMANIGTNYQLPTTNWSVEMVVDTQPTGIWAGLFGSDSYLSGYGHLALWTASTGNGFTVGSINLRNVYSVTNIPYTGLKHVVVTVASNTLKLYVNGTLITPATTGYTSSPATAGATLQFGSRHPNAGTANTPFDATPGTYYQMRVYSKALSQSEVTANYTASKVTTSGLP